MVPRADIVAVDARGEPSRDHRLITRSGHSRLPVYRDTLDDAIGMVHIKDVLAWRGQRHGFPAGEAAAPVLFVAPSMEVLELLLEMRATRSHMALVVDEFGGVDGLDHHRGSGRGDRRRDRRRARQGRRADRATAGRRQPRCRRPRADRDARRTLRRPAQRRRARRDRHAWADWCSPLPVGCPFAAS